MDQRSLKSIEDPSTTQHTDYDPCTLAVALQKGPGNQTMNGISLLHDCIDRLIDSINGLINGH